MSTFQTSIPDICPFGTSILREETHRPEERSIDRLDVEAFPGEFVRTATHASGEIRVLDEAGKNCRNGVRISWRHDESALAVDDGFAAAGSVGGVGACQYRTYEG